MPPPWKIRRELGRVFRQATGLPARVATYLLGARYFDLFLAGRVEHFDGRLPAGDRVAVYVIFPARGLKPSHLRSLRYLSSRDYAPLVVSNRPLAAGDRSKLLEQCWHYIERPNFGYDFGAYRQGVLHLGKGLANLRALALLNDSCWFPVAGDGDWLRDAERLEVDLAGAASNYGIRREPLQDLGTIRFEYSPERPGFHYCSFALLIGPRILGNPQFQRFWEGFPLTNDKTRTVRRGEIGLTKWALERGYSHGEVLDIPHLATSLQALSDDEIDALFHSLVIPASPRLKLAKEELARSPASAPAQRRTQRIAFILAVVAAQGISYALPRYNIFLKKLPFLKKSPVWLDEDACGATLDIVARLEGEIGDEIRHEIGELRRAPAVAAVPFESVSEAG